MDNPYTLKTVFTVHEAASAIHGITRLHRDDIPSLQSTCNELFHAIKSQDLPAHVPQRPTGWLGGQAIGFHPDYSSATIARADLLGWCELREIRPALLFPDPPPAKDVLHDSEQKTLLKIIRALAECNGMKSNQGGAYRKEAERLLIQMAKQGIQPPCTDKTLSKHLVRAFNSR